MLTSPATFSGLTNMNRSRLAWTFLLLWSGQVQPVSVFLKNIHVCFSLHHLFECGGHGFVCAHVCVCKKLLTLLACTLQSLIKTLAVPFVDQCSFDRPGWIFLFKNRIFSENRAISSAFRAVMILINSEEKFNEACLCKSSWLFYYRSSNH